MEKVKGQAPIVTQAAAAEVDPPQPGATWTQEAATTEIKALRAEAARYRVGLREAENQLQKSAKTGATAAQVQELTDNLERLRTEAEAKEAELQQERDQALSDATKAAIKGAVIAEAARRGFRNPDIAYKVLDLADVKVDGSEVSGVSEALEALAEAEDWMLGGTPRVGATNPPKGGRQARTDDDRKQEYFGGEAGAFWDGGGVVKTEEV